MLLLSLCGTYLALLLLGWLLRLWLLVRLLRSVRLLLYRSHRWLLCSRLHCTRLRLHGCRLGT